MATKNRSTKQKNRRRGLESNLAEHKRIRKELKPPLSQLNLSFSSWVNDRMPDMLWAILAIEFWPREKALSFFRHIGNFVMANKNCSDVTVTGVAKYDEETRRQFIKHITSWSINAKEMLRPMMLFEDMPGNPDWKIQLGNPVPEKDWERLGNAVMKTFLHQSEEATDCRWIKVLCEVLGGKMHFEKKMKESVRELLEYPNYGDLSHVQPFIRAIEITPRANKTKKDLNWPMNYWKTCYQKTHCLPARSRITEDLQPANWDKQRNFHLDETKQIRIAIINHFLNTCSNTFIDARHEACFGFALYGFTLFTEITLYQLDFALTGRMILRSLVECLITFKYLVGKDEIDLWNNYRTYGSGQAKLIYLKLQELSRTPDSIDFGELESIANEDMWVEFIPINLGHWDNNDLRKMSEETGLKEIYDQFYNWTSGFIHGNWFAIRGSVYESCLNPLHRLHRLPTRELPMGNSIVNDALIITNMIFDLLSRAYPPFENRLRMFKNDDMES